MTARRGMLALFLMSAVAVGACVLPARADRIVQTSVPTTLSGPGERECRVYLPPSYDLPAARAERYPVVVFLHGWPGGQGNWPGQGHAGETLDRLIAAKRIPEVIGLFPDGTGAGRIGRGLWLDSYDGKSKLETFLVHDLVAWADRTYRTRPMPSMRGVIGLSDGATGGMNLIMRHPDVYGAAGGHSGDYILQPDWSSGPLFGPEPGATRLRELHSPLLHVADHADILRRTVIYFDCGELDESMGENRRLHAVMDSLHIAHEFHAFPGSHDWGYWRAHLEQSLIAVTSRMRVAAGADSLNSR